MIGKTNVSQLLASIESRNPVYGTTNNAHSEKHSAGGSSGGEGAIIAAGGSPVGLGTDIGGSVRIPAAFNGICGIKPTGQRTVDKSRYLEKEMDLPIKSAIGVLANYPEDLHLCLDIINTVEGESKPTLQNYKDVDVSKLKVGYMLSDTLFEPYPAIQRGIKESITALQSLGTQTTAFKPPNPINAEYIYTNILTYDRMSVFIDNLKSDKPIDLLKGQFMLVKSPRFVHRAIHSLASLFGQTSIKRLVTHFLGTKKENLNDLESRLNEYTNEYLSALDNSSLGELDAIICPVFPTTALLHKTADMMGLGGTYTLQSNVTGFPSGVATVTHVKQEETKPSGSSLDIVRRTASKVNKSSKDLPVAIQIIAKPWNDHLVIALINQLHQNKYSLHNA